MIPRDLVLFIDGWNRSQGSGEPDAPTADEFADLVRQYG